MPVFPCTACGLNSSNPDKCNNCGHAMRGPIPPQPPRSIVESAFPIVWKTADGKPHFMGVAQIQEHPHFEAAETHFGNKRIFKNLKSRNRHISQYLSHRLIIRLPDHFCPVCKRSSPQRAMTTSCLESIDGNVYYLSIHLCDGKAYQVVNIKNICLECLGFIEEVYICRANITGRLPNMDRLRDLILNECSIPAGLRGFLPGVHRIEYLRYTLAHGNMPGHDVATLMELIANSMNIQCQVNIRQLWLGDFARLVVAVLRTGNQNIRLINTDIDNFNEISGNDTNRY